VVIEDCAGESKAEALELEELAGSSSSAMKAGAAVEDWFAARVLA
jgi:hypothetical protein